MLISVDQAAASRAAVKGLLGRSKAKLWRDGDMAELEATPAKSATL